MNEEQRKDEGLNETTDYAVAERKQCEEISRRYGWKQARKPEPTGQKPLQWRCIFEGKVRFPKLPNEPEQYERESDE